MNEASTIAAISSAPGTSARALVRLSGPGAGRVAATLLWTDARAIRGAFEGRRGCGTGWLRLAASGPSLPVEFMWWRGPGSFTGEDTLELLIPGNPLVVTRVMGVMLAQPGVRHATPGEFSARAYLNGRMSLEQAEGVAAGIAAQNAEELAAAFELASGRTGVGYAAIAEEIATLLALIEAGIDFTDQEDVRAISQAAFEARVRVLIEQVSAMGAGGAARETEPLVVLAGPPNAGKSTLFNALLGRERAIAAPIAGTTRDVLIEPVTISDGVRQVSVRLADVAGLDDDAVGPRGEIARAADARARETIAGADLVLRCDPGRGAPGARGPSAGHEHRPASGVTLAGASGSLGSGSREIRVRTFADRPAPGHGAEVEVCALDGYGLALLRCGILDRLQGSRSAGAAALVPRHAQALRQTALALGESVSSPEPEMAAQSLRVALDAMGEIAGRITPDEVLGRVFSRFCVGK